MLSVKIASNNSLMALMTPGEQLQKTTVISCNVTRDCEEGKEAGLTRGLLGSKMHRVGANRASIALTLGYDMNGAPHFVLKNCREE